MSRIILRRGEPGPIRSSMEDALARCPTEQARLSMMQTGIVIWAGALEDQAGPRAAVDALRSVAADFEKRASTDGEQQ